MRTPSDLQTFMNNHGIAGQILILETPTPTVADAAQAVGAQTEQIVKSVLFTIEEHAVLAVTCGDRPVERRAIAALYGVGRKRVKLASPEVVLQMTGYAVGTVPPFGHLQPIPTMLDPAVLANEYVYAGGGGENALVRLDPQVILQISGAQVVALH